MSQDIQMGLPREGMDMLSSEEDLRDGAYRRLRNVDISKEGIVRRRPGFKRVVNTPGMHSLYAYGDKLLFVDRGSLMLFNPETRVGDVLGLVGDSPLHYTEYNGYVYMSSIQGCWRLDNGVLHPVGVANWYSGGLPFTGDHDNQTEWAHKVTVAVSVVSPYGEESGAKIIGECDYSDLPESGDWGDLRLYSTSGAAGAWVLVGSVEPCEVLGMEVLPGGHFITGHKGRLCVAVDNCVVFSEALRPHLYDPATNVIPFVGKIKMLVSNGDCLYVADDRGVWILKGKDLFEASLERVSSAIIVTGSALVVPSTALPAGREDMDISEGEGLVVFLTEHGYVGGKGNGSLVNLSRGLVKLPAGREGHTVLLERDGMAQLVSAINATSLEAVGVAGDATF